MAKGLGGGSCCLDSKQAWEACLVPHPLHLTVRTQCREAVIITLLMVTTDWGSRTKGHIHDLV